MNKKYLLLLALPILALTVSGAVYAKYGQVPEQQTDLINVIAKKFNLNTADVQKVFDEKRIEHQAQMEQKFIDFINKAVIDGKLTQDLANKIIAKHAEIKAQRDSLQGKTPEEIKSIMKSQKDALKQWAQDNNIPLQYLMFGGQNGRGQGCGMGKLNKFN